MIYLFYYIHFYLILNLFSIKIITLQEINLENAKNSINSIFMSITAIIEII
jgi:hypothetical protein